MYPFEERLNYEKYVTAQLTRQSPIYDWYAFPHSFSKELVHKLLEEFEANQDTTVFDPFVGAGTTLLACREKGIPSFGVDQLPFAVFTSNVKVRDYNINDLQSVLHNFHLLEPTEPCFGSVSIIRKAFSKDVKKQIASIYAWIQKLPKKPRDFFLLALLYILEDVSKTAKSGGWLRYIENEVTPEEVVTLFKKRAQKMIDDLCSMDLPRNSSRWHARLGDARNENQIDDSVQCVISSPPYLNRHDYTRIFSLEMALHFVDTNQDLISIRHNSFRSHVEAKERKEFIVKSYRPSTRLSDLIDKIKERSKKRDKRRIPSMIKGYFEDIHLTLSSLYRRIDTSGKIAFVLGNVRYAGVMVPVDEIVAEIGEQIGLDVIKIIIARYTGNSAQQMGEFGRDPARESIILWEKGD